MLKMQSFIGGNLFKIILLLAQIILVTIVGILGRDIWYVIIISLIGLVFNFLVSINISYGFLFGFVYAIANGVYAYFINVYANFGFMIIMQAPMALYSFYTWKKNSNNNETTLKTMNWKYQLMLVAGMAVLSVASYYLLDALRSESIIPDTIFFVFSVTACILLAFRYKIAYILTLLSGLGGVALWTYTVITTGSGISLAVFYGIVSINSIIGTVKNYANKRSIKAPTVADI